MLEIFYYEKKLKKANIKEIQKIKNKQIWINATDITKQESDLLKTTFELHPLTAEDIFNLNTRIKVESFPNYLFCVFYGIHNTKSIELIELDFVLGANFVISNHKKAVASITALKNDQEKLENLFKKGNDFLFHKLLDNEIDNFFPTLDHLDDKIDLIEENVIKKSSPKLLSNILKLKRLVILIKRTAMPQREKISMLAKGEYQFLSKKVVPYFRDIYDNSIRVLDMVDSCRDAISNAFDVYMSTISNNMNEVMKVLSIIATIALPLTVISGIYGTNFSFLPGQHFHYGFWIMILAMLLLSLGMILFFRKRGWF